VNGAVTVKLSVTGHHRRSRWQRRAAALQLPSRTRLLALKTTSNALWLAPRSRSFDSDMSPPNRSVSMLYLPLTGRDATTVGVAGWRSAIANGGKNWVVKPFQNRSLTVDVRWPLFRSRAGCQERERME
jgi:hypothetical protein